MNQLKKLWASLPTWVKGLLIAAEGGAIGFIVQWATTSQPLCFSKSCLQQFGGAFAGAVIVSIRNWVRQSPLSAEDYKPSGPVPPGA